MGTAGGLRLFERAGSQSFLPRDTVEGLALVVGLYIDAGTLVYATSTGATTAIVRSPEPGMLGAMRHTEARGSELELTGFYATSGVGAMGGMTGNHPIAVVGLGRVIRVVSFTCVVP